MRKWEREEIFCIFVDVKTAYLSHWLHYYWDKEPVKLLLVRMAVMLCRFCYKDSMRS